MQKRPTCVTVFAVIDIILCALGVLGMAMYVVMQLDLIPQMNSDENPTMKLMEENPAYNLFVQVGTYVGFVATVALLCGAIGMLMLRNWARLTVIGWSVYTIIMTIFGTVLNHFLMFMPMLEDTQGSEKIGLQFGMVLAIGFGLIYIAYAALQMFMLTRPKVVDAFANPMNHQII
ncbi:MAG: hypothetical protein IT445_20620 [Phycisphaeraceae bacterium]|nr:hypothetical protein [Phycisphaeraceae bacterium]